MCYVYVIGGPSHNPERLILESMMPFVLFCLFSTSRCLQAITSSRGAKGVEWRNLHNAIGQGIFNCKLPLGNHHLWYAKGVEYLNIHNAVLAESF